MTDTHNPIARRSFLQGGAALAGAATLTGFESLARVTGAGATPAPSGDGGYGPLGPTRDQTTGRELLLLPRGFEYITYGWRGEAMTDGRPTPGNHDGMAAFRDGDLVRLVRNHELTTGPAIAPSGSTYDPSYGGGTANLVFDPDAAEWLESYGSLSGTIRNCAGGPTPWGTWLTCEETTTINPNGTRHGYVLEVPADGLSTAEPLIAMGRFSHEAVAVDPATGIVYLTEDRTPSGLYRFIPHQPGNLAAGGQLQMLAIGEAPRVTYADDTGTDYGVVSWVDIDQPDPGPGEVIPVNQGIARGGASFARGEGIWRGNGVVYFISTSGGPVGQGQVFELDPATDRLRILYASPAGSVLNAPDNITVSPRGGIVLCEDGSGTEYLHGLTTEGSIFRFCEHTLGGQEWAGACFEPKNGNWMFVNVFNEFTAAITGPWRNGAL